MTDLRSIGMPTVKSATSPSRPVAETSPAIQDSAEIGGSRPSTVPGFDRFAVVPVRPQQVGSPEGRESLAEQMAAELKQFPSLTAVIGMVPQGGTTGLIVASRENAAQGSHLEGEYEILQRLSSSPTMKQEAHDHPTAYVSVAAFDKKGLADEIRLPGQQDIQTLALELSEGARPNHDDQLKQLIDNLPKGRRVALEIGGPSAAGKSSLIKRIKELAGDRKVADFPGDMYFRDADDPKLPKIAGGGPYWDHPDAMHFDEMSGDIVKLVRDGHADIPIYDFGLVRPGGWKTPGTQGSGCRVEGKTTPTDMGADDILVIDSIHSTNKEVIGNLDHLGLAHASVYLDSPVSEDRLVRRVVRDYVERGRSPQQTLSDWDKTTFPGETNFVRPTLKQLDPAQDVFMVTKFPTDQELTRAEIDHKVQVQAQFGVEPTYAAFKTSDADMPAFALSEEKRFQALLDAPSSSQADRAHATKALEQLRKTGQK